MTILARILALTSGFALMGYPGPPATIIATSIIIDLSLAPLTAVIAMRRGRSTLAWAIAGLVLGGWALMAAMILPRLGSRSVEPPSMSPGSPKPPKYPPTSDAA